MSDILRPHGQQHARLPCPSATPGVCSSSCTSSQWGHITISSSAIPFSSCLQSFPALGSFPMSQLFISGGQIIGASASESFLSMNIQDLIFFRIEWFDIFTVQGMLKNVLQHHSSKASNIQCSAFFIAQLSHPYLTTGRKHTLTRWNFVSKWCFCFSIFCLGWS